MRETHGEEIVVDLFGSSVWLEVLGSTDEVGSKLKNRESWLEDSGERIDSGIDGRAQLLSRILCVLT